MGKHSKLVVSRSDLGFLTRCRPSAVTIALAASGVAAVLGASSGSFAQTATPPGAAASGSTLSDAVKKQAASPYKWILLNNTAARAPKKEAAKDPAPAPVAAPVAAAVGNSTTAAAAAATRRAEVAEAARVAAATAAAAAAAPVAVVAPPAPAPVVVAPVAAPAPVVAAVAPRPPPPAPPPPPPPKKINTELVVVTQVEPRLTPSILRDITQGSVKVSFTVNPDGSTSDVKIDSSTARVLNNPVMAAVREWKYKPIDIPQRTEQELAFKFD